MGLTDWWNTGYKPAERSMSIWDLIKDDASKITKNSPSQIGKGVTGWNPAKAFTPEMIKTGPTPLVRYALPRASALTSAFAPSNSIISQEEEMAMIEDLTPKTNTALDVLGSFKDSGRKLTDEEFYKLMDELPSMSSMMTQPTQPPLDYNPNEQINALNNIDFPQQVQPTQQMNQPVDNIGLMSLMERGEGVAADGIKALIGPLASDWRSNLQKDTNVEPHVLGKDVLKQAYNNFDDSLQNSLGGLADIVSKPTQAIQSMYDLSSGVLQHARPDEMSWNEKDKAMASAEWKKIKEDWSTSEGFQKMVAERPTEVFPLMYGAGILGNMVGGKAIDVLNNPKLLSNIDDVVNDNPGLFPSELGGRSNVVAYHGTDADLDLENLKTFAGGDFGEGIYFAEDVADAGQYGNKIYKADVELKSPLVLNDRYQMNGVWDEFIGNKKTPNQTINEYLKEQGYDGITVKNSGMGSEVKKPFHIAFDKSAVKSFERSDGGLLAQEPLVVYRSSTSGGYDKFDKSKQRTSTLGKGVYMFDNETGANDWVGSNLQKIELPYDYMDKSINWGDGGQSAFVTQAFNNIDAEVDFKLDLEDGGIDVYPELVKNLGEDKAQALLLNNGIYGNRKDGELTTFNVDDAKIISSEPKNNSLSGGLLGQPSNFNKSKKDASDIFGEGAERVRYTDPDSGGTIEVVTKQDGSASVLELIVPEEFRGKGIGQSLQKQVMDDFPKMGGQVSSKAAATTAYKLGRRPIGNPDATLDDVFKMIDENSSVNLVSKESQIGGLLGQTGQIAEVKSDIKRLKGLRGKELTQRTIDELRWAEEDLLKLNPLVAHHNLSSEALAKHSEYGGDIAMPSLGISKPDAPFGTNQEVTFGEISLLGDSDMINPSKSNTYSSDAYTGRSPQERVVFEQVENIKDAIGADTLKFHNRAIYDKGLDDPEGLMVDMRLSELLQEKGFNKADYPSFLSMKRDASINMGDHLRTMIYEAESNPMQLGDSKRYLLPDGGKKKPFTPKAALTEMRKQGGHKKGSEREIGDSDFLHDSRARALTSEKYQSLDKLTSERSRVQSRGDYEHLEDGFSTMFDLTIDKIEDVFKTSRGSKTDAYKGDTNSSVLRFRPKKNMNRLDSLKVIQEILLDNDVPDWMNLSPSDRIKIQQLVKPLEKMGREMPTAYFESKPNRIVNIGEFKTAIVPTGDTASIKRLEKLGIKNIIEYKDQEGYVNAFKKNPELFFSKALIPTGGLLAASEDDEQEEPMTGLLD